MWGIAFHCQEGQWKDICYCLGTDKINLNYSQIIRLQNYFGLKRTIKHILYVLMHVRYLFILQCSSFRQCIMNNNFSVDISKLLRYILYNPREGSGFLI